MSYRKREFIRLCCLAMGIQATTVFLNKLFNILHINPYANTEFFRLSGDIKKDIVIISLFDNIYTYYRRNAI